MLKKIKPKMQDPPRFPKVTVPIDNSFKKEYKGMIKSLGVMLKKEINAIYDIHNEVWANHTRWKR